MAVLSRSVFFLSSPPFNWGFSFGFCFAGLIEQQLVLELIGRKVCKLSTKEQVLIFSEFRPSTQVAVRRASFEITVALSEWQK